MGTNKKLNKREKALQAYYTQKALLRHQEAQQYYDSESSDDEIKEAFETVDKIKAINAVKNIGADAHRHLLRHSNEDNLQEMYKKAFSDLAKDTIKEEENIRIKFEARQKVKSALKKSKWSEKDIETIREDLLNQNDQQEDLSAEHKEMAAETISNTIKELSQGAQLSSEATLVTLKHKRISLSFMDSLVEEIVKAQTDPTVDTVLGVIFGSKDNQFQIGYDEENDKQIKKEIAFFIEEKFKRMGISTKVKPHVNSSGMLLDSSQLQSIKSNQPQSSLTGSSSRQREGNTQKERVQQKQGTRLQRHS